MTKPLDPLAGAAYSALIQAAAEILKLRTEGEPLNAVASLALNERLCLLAIGLRSKAASITIRSPQPAAYEQGTARTRRLGAPEMTTPTDPILAKRRTLVAFLPSALRRVCRHDSTSVAGCLHCEAADMIEDLTFLCYQAEKQQEDARDAERPLGFVKPDNERQVFFYEQDFYVLSNFSAFRVTFDGQTFDTSEAAYHYQRFTRAEDRRGVMYANSAHEAFRYAQDHKANQRRNWDSVKVDIMRDILRAKAQQHEYVRRKLLATGDRELIEDSWRDDYWGWGPNRDGKNILGRLWMEVRAELRAALPPMDSQEQPGGGV